MFKRLTLEDGTDLLSRNVGNLNQRRVTPQKSDDLIYTASEGWNRKNRIGITLQATVHITDAEKILNKDTERRDWILRVTASYSVSRPIIVTNFFMILLSPSGRILY